MLFLHRRSHRRLSQKKEENAEKIEQLKMKAVDAKNNVKNLHQRDDEKYAGTGDHDGRHSRLWRTSRSATISLSDSGYDEAISVNQIPVIRQK